MVQINIIYILHVSIGCYTLMDVTLLMRMDLAWRITKR